MAQRRALLLATFLTVFGLVVISAVVLRVTAGQAATKRLPADSREGRVTEAVTVGDPQTLLAEREAEYQAALAQANAQLAAAYDQLVGSAEPSAAEAGGSTGPAISPEMAAQIGTAAVGAPVIRTPELVEFEGSIAYEVTTGAGIAYVDATTGSVLYNGVTPQTVPLPPVGGTLSEEQAIAIARSVAGPGDIEKAELDEEHGVLVWEIEFANDNVVQIDAQNGAVVHTEFEDDDRHDDREDYDEDDDDDRDDDD